MQKVQAETQSEIPTQFSPGGTEKKHEMRELTQLYNVKTKRYFHEIKGN